MTRELWVETDGFGRCRLDGNAHTFRGRISAYSEALDTWVTISRSDIRGESAEVSAWLDGFLAGNEPEFHHFLGIDPGEESELADEHEGWDRYQAVLDEFRRTGGLPFRLNSRPTKPPPAGLRPEPWALAGGLVLRWNGSSWVAQEPQPAVRYGGLAGTLCDEGGHHALEVADDNYLVCADCGELSEYEYAE